MATGKKFTSTHALIIGVAVILAIAIGVYLGTESCYMGNCATGFEVLKYSFPSFWTWVVLGSIAAVVLFYLSFANETGKGFMGPKLPGSSTLTLILLIAGLLAMVGPWGVACGEKANGGLNVPKNQTEQTLP